MMPDCSNCGLAAFVNKTELGYLCVMCLHHWPYDPLEREPDYDFQEYRTWCETAALRLLWAELDFLRWLYSPMNTRSQ